MLAAASIAALGLPASSWPTEQHDAVAVTNKVCGAANNKATIIGKAVRKAAKGQQQLDAAGTADIPVLATYPTLDAAVTLHGLKALSCPAYTP